MALRYRQLEQPTLVDTTSLENGDSQAATSLARAFKSFEGMALEPAANLRSQLGERQGAEAGSNGKPDLRSGLAATTAYGQAYNNSAMRSYAVKAESDAEDQAARLEIESGNDPEKFSATFSAVRDETLKNAPPEARGILATIYAKRGGDAITRIHSAQATELQKQARADTSEGVQRSVDRIATLRASDDPAKMAEADEEQVKLNLLIDGAHNDSTISRAEWQALHLSSQRQVVAQTVAARFGRELDNPYGDPVAFIERLKKANETSEVLAPAEEDALVAGLLSDLREKNSLEAAGAANAAREEKARYEAGDREATGKLLAGGLSTRYLSDMVAQQRLDPSVARTLLNELQAGDTAADDTQVAFDVRTNLLNYSEQDIATMPGLKWSTRGDLLLKRREEASGWKGTQAAKEGEDRIYRALGIVPGTMMAALDDDEKRQLQQAKTEWYDVVDKLEPAERQGAVISSAQDVIGKFIRKNKANEAQDLRNAKSRWMARKNIDDMSPSERKEYDLRAKKYDADIAAAEAEAARK